MGLLVPFSLPAGSISQYAGAVAPPDWLLAYGQAVSRTTYAALFAAIGTTFGAGDGSTTFNLPDFRGRNAVGKDNMGGVAANRVTTGGGGVDGLTLGAVGGSETKTLTSAQIPAHAHPVTTVSSNTRSDGGGAGSNVGPTGATNTSNNTGAGGAHSVMQPAIIINYIIKT